MILVCDVWSFLFSDLCRLFSLALPPKFLLQTFL
jgi:hypothetical protein